MEQGVPAKLAAAEAAAARDDAAALSVLTVTRPSSSSRWPALGAFVQGATGLGYGLVVTPALFAALEPRQAIYRGARARRSS